MTTPTNPKRIDELFTEFLARGYEDTAAKSGITVENIKGIPAAKAVVIVNAQIQAVMTYLAEVEEQNAKLRHVVAALGICQKLSCPSVDCWPEVDERLSLAGIELCDGRGPSQIIEAATKAGIL